MLKINLKKGELSSKMVVTIILLMVGFVIIFIIYASFFDWEGMTHKEVCHNSVVMRGTLPSTLNIQEMIPLNCKTQKICVRGGKLLFGKGECNEFSGEKDVRFVDVKNLDEVNKLIADEIVDCWSMMGEGELSLYPSGWAGIGASTVTSQCVICSRISFDTETLKERGVDVSERDILRYMRNNYVPNQDKTYFEFISGGKAQISDTPLPEKMDVLKEDGSKQEVDVVGLINTIQAEEERNGNSGDEEIAVLFMQISAPRDGEVLSNLGFLAAGTGATMLVSPISGGLAKGVFNICKSSVVTGIICAAIGGGFVGHTLYKAKTNRDIAAMRCQDVLSGGEERLGCSVVRTVKYDRDSIRMYCDEIASIA